MTDFIFKKDNDGKMYFNGDFEGLYLNEDDPWGQSGINRKEYTISREKQIEILKTYVKTGFLLDIGCGLGYSTEFYNKFFHSTGLDISKTAITKAECRYPFLNFINYNVAEPKSLGKYYDILIINQLLWYILPEFEKVLHFIELNINQNGYILLSNFIFDRNNQKFGNEYFTGIAEILSWLEGIIGPKMKIIEYYCKKIDEKYYDFHVVLIKNN